MTTQNHDPRKIEIAKLILADLVPAEPVAEATGLPLAVVQDLVKGIKP